MIQTSTFKPLWYLKNPHLQTILANIFHPPKPEINEETLELPDGDFLELAWTKYRSDKTLIIMHGLEGSIKSSYAQRILNYCHRHQMAAVLLRFRGCGSNINRKLRAYHSGETEDLKQVIKHLKTRGVNHIALLGYSLGGNVALKYMGEQITDVTIKCAISVSVPMLLDDCANTMNLGFSRVYQRSLLNSLLKKLKQKQHLLQQQEKQYADPDSIKNFVQFDDAFTAPIHGFQNAQDYYKKSSSRQFLGEIKKPTLIIHSTDDPFMTEAVIPDSSELSDQITLELSSNGGHVGFIGGGLIKPKSWLEPRIYQFLRQHFL